MRDEHILDLLDRQPFAGLRDAERERVEAHAERCATCARALEAALVAGELLEARTAEIVEPPPFFATRVMAAVRERVAAADERSVARLWRAARGLVAAMAVAVVLLACAALFASRPEPEGVAPIYTSEWSALETTDDAPGDLSDDQLVAILYDSEDVYGQGR